MEGNEELDVQSSKEIEQSSEGITQSSEEIAQSNDGAVTEDTNATLSKDAILEASRKENKNGDERERQGMLSANSLAMSVGLFVIAIVLLVSLFVKGKLPCEVLMIQSAITTTQSIVNAVKNSRYKALYIVSSVTVGLCCIAFAVLWILELCGVAL